MPPTRRRSGNTGAANHSSGQPTLNFGTKSRVSKPASRSLLDTKQEKLSKADSVSSPTISSSATSPAPVPVHEIEEKKAEQQPTEASTRSENVIREQSKVELQLPKSEDDIKAENLTDAEIRKYWEAEENKRTAPRVHQEGLSTNEKILRHFDLCGQYGPCMGIARIKRWRRANKLDLHPPIEVLAVLLREEAKGTANEKAYVDELMS